MPAVTPTPDSPFDWHGAKARHIARVDVPTRDHLSRRSRGQRHPVWDFIFEYYPVKSDQLRRWSPDIGVEPLGATAKDISYPKLLILDADGATGSPASKESTDTASGTVRMDVSTYVDKRGKTVAYIGSLLCSTRANPAHFDCFGLHEQAMAYRQPGHRHPEPLQLGQAGTDEVVKVHTARHTYFDVFCFFTPDAVPPNEFASTCETQPYREQMDYLHTNVDLYEWAIKLGEAVSGGLWVDTFEPACSAHELDVRAVPYDLRDWGFASIRIEAPEGKVEYAHRQRELSACADVLRGRLPEVVDVALSTQ